MTRDTWLQRNWKLLLVAVAITLFVIIPVLWNWWLAPTIFTENRDAGQNIAENTIDAEVSVQQYREFRQLWFDIKAERQQLENYRQQEQQFHETYGDDPSNWTRTDKTRHSRLHDRIVGTQNQVERMVAEYNAMTSDATQALFACGLPYNVDEKLFISDATGVEYTSQEAKNTRPPEDPSECQFSEAPGENDG